VLAHERAGALMQDSCGDLIGPCQNNYGIDFEAIPELKPAMPTLNSSIDFVAYDREGQVVLLAEAKSRRGTSEAWAASLRRNMLAHGVLPWAKYFLIATPERMYLWQQEHPTSPEALPDFTIDAEKVFQPYFQKLTLESSEIGPAAFEHLVLTWLTEIARSDEGKPKQETSSAWLSELSRSLQEARIEMNPMR